MYTREKLDAMWVKFINHHRDFNGPLLTKPPTDIAANGYSLWGGSIQLVAFEHQSGSRSGKSEIVVTCLPNRDDGDPLFTVTHFHHEGSSSEVETVDSITKRIEERSAPLAQMLERALANPELTNTANHKNWNDSEFFFEFASQIYCVSMDVEALSIMKAYI